jgi:decaprenylphospho-beta-D-ribofuranose 2-oxidase
MNLKNNNFSYTSFVKKKITKPKNIKQLIKLLKNKHTILGNKRSYGDSFIGNYLNISMLNFDKIIKFDKKKNTIEVESGVILDSINKKIIPNGFILDCSPGCKYVSVGGMISNNISGKLSQNNSIYNKIISIKIIDKNFKLKNCSLKKNKKIFNLVVGGKGKVGPIISTILKLEKIKSDDIIQKAYFFSNYQIFNKNIQQVKENRYCVVWINFLKKNFSGIFFFGNHRKSKGHLRYKNNDIKFSSKFLFFLSYFINTRIFSILFNFLFELSNLINPKKTLHLLDYFFPQNKIINWNEIFKKEGFIQFHFFLRKKI